MTPHPPTPTLFPYTTLFRSRRTHLRCAVRERQNHISIVQAHTLLVIDFSRYESERKPLKAFTKFQESPLSLPPQEHAWMRRIGKIEFTRGGVESTRNNGCEPERAARFFIG